MLTATTATRGLACGTSWNDWPRARATWSSGWRIPGKLPRATTCGRFGKRAETRGRNTGGIAPRSVARRRSQLDRDVPLRTDASRRTRLRQGYSWRMTRQRRTASASLRQPLTAGPRCPSPAPRTHPASPVAAVAPGHHPPHAAPSRRHSRWAARRAVRANRRGWCGPIHRPLRPAPPSASSTTITDDP